ncbi:MAG: hypothetical protein U9Q77_08940 [Candidatus Marinimicrobia bacterium]|nr:hypothetical protein [Candidatus Neomarinimicrobiota bacterium]
MSPIKNIGNLPPEFRRSERNEKQSQVKKSSDLGARAPTAKTDQSQKISQDQVNVSDSARTLLQRDAEIQRFTGEMSTVETLSAEEQQVIEAKIESDFYSSPEVISTVAGKIADETTSAKLSLSPTRMQEVLENIRENQYASDAVIDVVADKIIKDL